MSKDDENVSSLLQSVAAFVVCSGMMLWSRRNSGKAVQQTVAKDLVRDLRNRHFSSSVSVSYSNSGGLMIVKGEGTKLIDESGVSYLDTRNNVAHVGHCNSRVVEAVQRQVAMLNTNTRYLHPNVSLLADRLLAKCPSKFTKVFFVNSGSEANDLALRLARAYTGSRNSVVVADAYHGHTLSVLEVSPYKYEHSREFHPTRHPGAHILKVPCPSLYRSRLIDGVTNDKEAVDYFVQAVRDGCQHFVEKGESVGAFIMEGGMSVGGAILPPRRYLVESVDAIRKAGGLWIADEVQTGFGRLGGDCFWAFQCNDNKGEHAVLPDIITMGKPFGNGMPLGAVVTTDAIVHKFESMGVEYFNTFGGNPVCAAAGLAVLDEIERLNLMQHATVVGRYMRENLLQLGEECPLIGDVRGQGLFMGVEFVRDRKLLTPATEETSFLCTMLKKKYHILTSVDGPYESVLIVKPPMTFSVKDADYFLDAIKNVLQNDLPSAGDLSTMGRTPT